MLRVLFFLILVFLLGLGFAWLAERPGNLVITFNGYEYQLTLMVAAVMVTALIAGIMILWWLMKNIWRSPHTVARYFRARRRDRGYQALSTGLIAAGAGDPDLARRMHKQSAKLLNPDQEPLIHLLEAQAFLLDGDHEAARRSFETMLDDPEMRLLGLRGLYLEAERLGDRGVARHYAERASAVAPQLGWAAKATLETRMAEGDWDGALRLLDAQKSTRQIDREAAKRNRAVLLTAKAIHALDTDALAAKNAALEANRLDPALVPAAVTAAKALFRQDDLRKGAKILEAAWRKEPHPEIADAYVHARPGDSTHDRLKRARKLRDIKQNHPESAIALARAALDAGEFALARESAEAALRMQPRESFYLLMADIEEAETGDIGRVREWLAKAVRAPRDPAWTADGYVSENWAPYSPVTGELGAFEWRVPLERLGALIEEGPKEVRGPIESDDDMKAIAPPGQTVPPAPEDDPQPAIAEPAPEAPPRATASTELQPTAAAQETAGAAMSPPAEDAPQAPARPQEQPSLALVAAADSADHGELPRRPDDPGVDADMEQREPRRFRLF